MIRVPYAGDGRKALEELVKVCESRLIMRDAGAAAGASIPYLWRTYLCNVDSNDCSAFLHKFVSSDAVGELHCHPWVWSVSFILAGSYRELRAAGTVVSGFGDGRVEAKLTTPLENVFQAGDRNFISAETFHRVELLTPEVWTLFIHGPRTAEWGFVEEGKYDAYLPMRVIRERTYDVAPKEVPQK